MYPFHNIVFQSWFDGGVSYNRSWQINTVYPLLTISLRQRPSHASAHNMAHQVIMIDRTAELGAMYY